MIVGAIIFACGCGGGLIAGYIGGMGTGLGSSFASMTEPVRATIQVDLPDRVIIGEPFDLRVTISDQSGADLTLATVDLTEALADAFTVVDLAPASASVSDRYGYDEYEFFETVPANGSLDIVFTLVCDTPGTQSGLIHAYFDDFRSIERRVSVDVLPSQAE